MLEAILDRRVRDKIRDRIDGLAEDPEKQGKPLTGELTGYRSLRAVGQRYRIICRIEEGKVLILVMALGVRKEAGRIFMCWHRSFYVFASCSLVHNSHA